MCVSVIIPALDEESSIAATIDSACVAGAKEIVVSDGGSRDQTRDVARARGAVVIDGGNRRGLQLNRGAAVSSSDIFLFLHADTRIPPDAIAAIERSVAGGAEFGAFQLRFAERSLRLRVAERMINLRTFLTRAPWGDQGQFITRSRFLATGGYLEIPIMEDYELALRMKRTLRPAILPLAVTTSGRRFLERGILRTTLTNWRVVIAYRLGTDPETLARMYRE